MKITANTLRHPLHLPTQEQDGRGEKEEGDEVDKEESGKGELKVKWRAPSDHSTAEWIGIWAIAQKKKELEKEREREGDKESKESLHSSGSGTKDVIQKDTDSGGGKVWPWGRGPFAASSSIFQDNNELIGKCIAWQFVSKGRKGTMYFSFKDRLPLWAGRYVNLQTVVLCCVVFAY